MSKYQYRRIDEKLYELKKNINAVLYIEMKSYIPAESITHVLYQRETPPWTDSLTKKKKKDYI